MKYISTITAELVMVWVILNPSEITETVKDFITLGFVIELDDLFASSSVSAQELEEVIEESEPLKIDPRHKYGKKPILDKVHPILSNFYYIFIFYAIPYSVFIIECQI